VVRVIGLLSNVSWLYDVGLSRRVGAGVAEGKPRDKGPCARRAKARKRRSVRPVLQDVQHLLHFYLCCGALFDFPSWKYQNSRVTHQRLCQNLGSFDA